MLYPAPSPVHAIADRVVGQRLEVKRGDLAFDSALEFGLGSAGDMSERLCRYRTSDAWGFDFERAEDRRFHGTLEETGPCKVVYGLAWQR
jgi:hypothetical protein